MKTLPSLHLAAIASCLFVIQESKVDAKPHQSPPPVNAVASEQQVSVQIEFIEVLHTQYTELMQGKGSAINGTELRSQLSRLITEGKATIVESMLCTAPDRQMATTESVEEFIYPTEYEVASLPQNGNEIQTLQQLGIGLTPSAFETRNLGSTLEIEPSIIPGKNQIRVRMSPEIVSLVGSNVWTNWKGPSEDSPVQMPLIYTVRLKTTVTLKSGQPFLVAALSPKDKEGHIDTTRKWMVFAKADIVAESPPAHAEQ